MLVETRAGVRADETGTGGDLFAPDVMLWWLGALAFAGAAALVALRRPRAPGAAEPPAVPGSVVKVVVPAVALRVAVGPLTVAAPLLALVLVGLVVQAQRSSRSAAGKGRPTTP